MPISIKDPETDRLARALAAATGESLTEAIRRALQDRLDRETRRSRLPVLDPRSAEEIVGYDDHGLPR